MHRIREHRQRAVESPVHSREWRNWQTRRIQVPVPVRVWGFKSPLAHFIAGSVPQSRSENPQDCESSGARRVCRAVRRDLGEHASKTYRGTVTDAVEDQSEQRIQRA